MGERRLPLKSVLNTHSDGLTVELPLHGEWTAVHTPADRVPSHGTHQLAQTYAYDFLRIDWDKPGYKFHTRSTVYYGALGVRLDECYGWSAPVMAPFTGEVVVAPDGWPERRRVHFVRDLAVVLKNAFTADLASGDLRFVVGNHVVLRSPDGVYALLAHLRCGSVLVGPGTAVRAGQPLAQVGHSGNSTAPHLHFQLMDGPDPLVAKGLPCAFACYEAFQAGAWKKVQGGIPAKRERIRRDV